MKKTFFSSGVKLFFGYIVGHNKKKKEKKANFQFLEKFSYNARKL